ncbi:hypothetical protein VTP01DRAFT_8122 [Rhizomucor pusillus]|uniref:uncharacterized protein n=1 Tax=Rhizomucor pusillus TaxID=4840 RepID=UPI00374246DD
MVPMICDNLSRDCQGQIYYADEANSSGLQTEADEKTHLPKSNCRLSIRNSVRCRFSRLVWKQSRKTAA